MSDELIPQGQLLIYNDGGLNLQVRLDGQTVWLTQAQIAELYQTTPQNITLHVQRIYDDSELPEDATCKEYLQVRQEGSRQVQRALKHYSLDMILAVGYRHAQYELYERQRRELEAVSASDFDEAAKRIAEQAPPPPKPRRRKKKADDGGGDA